MKNIQTKLAVIFLTILFCIPAMIVHADDITPAPIPAPAEMILVRDGNTVIYQGTANLPTAGTVSIIDDTGTAHSINADSVLGLLYSISQTSGLFSLSDIQYYSSLGSLYLKCLTPAGTTQACDNWQYLVNGATPSTGMDSTVLSGGETIGLYFGSSHEVIFDTTSITAGGSFTATAQQYNYLDNTWSPLTGVTIGATVPNSNDPYNPTVVISQAVDTNGTATLTLADSGMYTVGIADDYYFPAYTMTVLAPVQSGGGSGGGSIVSPAPVFSVPDAVAYLTGVQSPDGSFGGSDLYTDWAAIAFGAATVSGAAETNLLNYMASHNTVHSMLTDNERHAMALLALGQNPYSFYGTDYITPIINSFDGTQFGDPTLDNDDIFALIPLASAGYTIGDTIITKDIAFIISKQNPDGSWDESPDMTAVAVEALEPFSSVNGVADSLSKSSTYLQNIQSSDGGFGSVYSTSWVAQAMSALGVSWAKNGNVPANYLAVQQAGDGAALPASETLQNRIWATSYAIPAALGQPWGTIMHAVPKPASSPQIISSGRSGGGFPVVEQTTPMVPDISSTAATPVAPPAFIPAPQILIPITTTAKPAHISKSTGASRNVRTLVKSASHQKVQPLALNMKTSDAVALHDLPAAAATSGTSAPVPIIAGLLVAIGIIIFSLRRFLIKPPRA